jgi:putative ABC transport system substrate-binding protein
MLLSCAVAPAFAQDASRPPVIGLLRLDTKVQVEPFAAMFRDALAALGWVDGKNVHLDFRLAEGDAERLPELAEALVREKVNVIYAAGPAAARAAQHATRTIPIVATTSDLVAFGLIASLAKPGGNITGVSLLVPELEGDRTRCATFRLVERSGDERTSLQVIADTARALGVELQTTEVRSPDELPAALASLRAGGIQGVNVLSSPLFNSFRKQLGELLLSERLPAICEWREMTVSGCLASYGTTLRELFAIMASLTDKILKGALPGDTPAQQPTKFELVINMRMAHAIGVDIPRPILARADEVIE